MGHEYQHTSDDRRAVGVRQDGAGGGHPAPTRPILTVELFLKTDYRRAVAYPRDWSDLRAVPGIKKLPRFTTLQAAHARLDRCRRHLGAPESQCLP